MSSLSVKKVQTIFINTKNRTEGSVEDCIVHLPDNMIRADEAMQLRLTILHWCLNKSFYNVREGFKFILHNATSGTQNNYTIRPGNYDVCSFAKYFKSVILGKDRWTFEYDHPTNKYRIKAPQYLYDRDDIGVEEDVYFEFINCGHLFGFEDGITPITNHQTFLYSNRPVLMNTDNSVYLHCDIPRKHGGAIQNHDKAEFHDSSILAVIPIQDAPFENMAIDCSNAFTFYLNTNKIDKIRLWVTNERNEPLPLRHDYTLALKVEHLQINHPDYTLNLLGEIRDAIKYMALHPKFS